MIMISVDYHVVEPPTMFDQHLSKADRALAPQYVKDDQGNLLKDGTFEKTERYGRLVGRLAEQALQQVAEELKTQIAHLELQQVQLEVQQVRGNSPYHKLICRLVS